MGWLGWTEPEAMAADVNAIEVAMRGRWAMLEAVFGGGGASSHPTVNSRPMTPQLFDALGF